MKKITLAAAVMFLICAIMAVSCRQRTEIPEGRVGVSYMGWGNEVEQEIVKNILNTFNSSQDRIWASYISSPESGEAYMARLNTMAAAGSLPDAAMLGEDQVLRWASNNMLLDLTDLFQTIEEQPIDAVAFRYRGRTVAYSLANEIALLYYNRDMFDAAGLPYPPARAEDAWTWDQFVDIAKRLTKDTAGRTPYDPGFDHRNIVTYGASFLYWSNFWPVLGVSMGDGGWFTEDLNTLLIDHPDTIAAAQALADLHLVHYVSPNPAIGIDDPAVAMLSGQIAMAVDGQWAIGLSYLNAMKEGLNYGIGVLPKHQKPVTNNFGGPAVLFNTSKNPNEAREMLRRFYDPELNLEMIQSGIWMPIRQSWYHEERHIRTWADHPLRPPLEQYRHAAINYALNNLVQSPFYYFAGWSEFNDLLTPAMDPVWQGAQTARQAITAVAPALRDVLARHR